jgi:hypothetical protein
MLYFPLFLIFYQVWRWSWEVPSMGSILNKWSQEASMEYRVYLPALRKPKPVVDWS